MYGSARKGTLAGSPGGGGGARERWAVLPLGPFRPAQAGTGRRWRAADVAPNTLTARDSENRGPPTAQMTRDSGPPPGELATGLRPASRGSAKPVPMALRHPNVRAASPSNCQWDSKTGQKWDLKS